MTREEGPKHHVPRSPNGSTKKEVPVRSVRVDDALWARARARATYEGVTMSQVLYEFTKGYAEGLLNRPKVQLVYTQPTEAVEVPATGGAA
jgi:hypothetical protein